MRITQLGSRNLPTLYLALFGGLQLAFLWAYRGRFGVAIPIVGTALFLGLLLLVVRVSGRWTWKLLALGLLVGVMTFGPSIAAMAQRQHTGLSFECDCMAMDEVAVDRLTHGQAIYGVDWSQTQVAGYAGVWGGLDLHYYAHFPLMGLSAVPVRVLTDAAHVPFDYRMVLIVFSLIAIAAIAWLPVPLPARFAVVVAVLLNPALSLGAWTGHDDICYLAMLFVGLTLLARKHLLLACLAFGIAAALKPFGLLALPLLLAIIWIRRAQPRRTRLTTIAIAGAAFALPTLLTVGPFLLRDASAFYRDVFVYPTSLLPIGGFGFGALLVGLHIVPSDGTFPFAPFEFVALTPAYWFALRALARRGTLAQFVASYCLALFAFLFFARYFADNYLAALIGLVLCVPLLTVARCDPVEDLPSPPWPNRTVDGVAEPGALPLVS
jgi:hypothetical protein